MLRFCARTGRRNSHSEHEALRELKNELMAQWDGVRGSAPGGPRIMVRSRFLSIWS